jgi:CO/xanthine dehydrogenase Mo-binding subunit
MGSRSGTLGGKALQTAAVTVRGTLLEAAAALLEASPADIILQDGAVTVRGVPGRRASLGEVVVSLGNGPLTSQSSFNSQGGDMRCVLRLSGISSCR